MFSLFTYPKRFIHQAGQSSSLQIFPLALGLGSWRPILPVKTGMEAALSTGLQSRCCKQRSTNRMPLSGSFCMTISRIRQILLYALNIDHLELSLQPEIYKKWGKKTKQNNFLGYLNVPSKPYKCISVFAYGFWPFNSPAKATFHLQNHVANAFHKRGSWAREEHKYKLTEINPR